MRSRAAANMVPAYLLLCLLLGGSGQDPRPSLVLQFLAAALIAYASLKERPEPLPGSSKSLLTFAVGLLTLVLIQLIPLPASLWTLLPGRNDIAAAYSLLGHPLPWLPLSLTPYATLDSLLSLLPPLAILIGIIRLRPSEDALAFSILGGTIAGILLAALQVSGGVRFYLYPITNGGGVGFFANRNFMGTLLLASIPFTLARIGEARPNLTSLWTSRMVAGALLLLILTGVALNRSLAAALLVLPVMAASLLMLISPVPKAVRVALPAAAVAGLALLFLVIDRPTPTPTTLGADGNVSIVSRTAIWSQTAEAIADSFPAGTGLGSFAAVYRTYEEPNLVGRWFVNQAHNDYLQLALETGLLGLMLLMAFFCWWALRAYRIWSSQTFRPLSRAATIASAAILLHSAVDYPLHTTSIAALFASCLAIMVQPLHNHPRKGGFDRHGVRHIKIG